MFSSLVAASADFGTGGLQLLMRTVRRTKSISSSEWRRGVISR